MAYGRAIKKILEREMERIEGKNYQTAGAMLGVIRKLGQSADSLDAMARARNPAETEAAHFQRIYKAGERLAKVVSESKAQSTELLNNATQNLGQKLSERSGLRPPVDLAETILQSEARQAIRAMGEKERNELLANAAHTGDVATLNAVFNGPAYLTGYDGEYMAAMRRLHEQKAAPDVSEEWNAMLEADNALQAALRAAQRAATEAKDERAMAQIMRDIEAAERAGQQFDAALEG